MIDSNKVRLVAIFYESNGLRNNIIYKKWLQTGSCNHLNNSYFKYPSL